MYTTTHYSPICRRDVGLPNDVGPALTEATKVNCERRPLATQGTTPPTKSPSPQQRIERRALCSKRSTESSAVAIPARLYRTGAWSLPPCTPPYRATAHLHVTCTQPTRQPLTEPPCRFFLLREYRHLLLSSPYSSRSERVAHQACRVIPESFSRTHRTISFFFFRSCSFFLLHMSDRTRGAQSGVDV